jgi:hypothetical protein
MQVLVIAFPAVLVHKWSRLLTSIHSFSRPASQLQLIPVARPFIARVASLRSWKTHFSCVHIPLLRPNPRRSALCQIKNKYAALLLHPSGLFEGKSVIVSARVSER